MSWKCGIKLFDQLESSLSVLNISPSPFLSPAVLSIQVGFFDASIEIICQNRVIKIQCKLSLKLLFLPINPLSLTDLLESFSLFFSDDTPYIKALPVKITVRENLSTGEFSEREIRSTFKDPYTSEWEALHAALKIGKGLKTTVEDAAEDLEVFGMILEKIV